MSRKKPNLVFILWDIGSGSKKVDSDGTTLFEKQKQCVSQIIRNKILFEPIDQIALMKFNAKETNHTGDMATFTNIDLVFEFGDDKMKMLEDVEKTTATDIDQEFLGAVCVALTIIRKKIADAKKADPKKKADFFESIKLILASTLNTGSFNNDETRTITKHIKNIGCSFFVIGPNVEVELEEKQVSLDFFKLYPDAFNAETAIRLMFQYVNGIYWHFDEALMNLMSVTSRKVTPRMSKILLEFGSELNIKVQSFNEVQEESRLEFKVLNEPDIEKKTGYDRVYTTKGGKRKMVDEEEIIPGFKFGTSIIPFSSEDKSAMEYKSGPPCLKIIGFCKQKDISPIMYVGDTTVNILPQPTDQVSVFAFKSLVRAMHSNSRVAIVRRVSMNNGKLMLGALLPRVLTGEERLIFVELPFAEDVINYTFPRVKNQISQDHVDTVRDLVSKMDLMSEDGSEHFQLRSTPNPSKIYTNQVVLDRALRPDAPIEPPSKLVASILEPPEAIVGAAQGMEAELKKVFNIAAERASQIKVQRIPRASTNYRAPRPSDQQKDDHDSQNGPTVAVDDIPQAKAIKIVQIGSITPAEDFQELVRQGVPLADVCKQCQTVILQLAVRTQHDLHRPLTAIRVMRSECVSSNPALYNNWLPELRNELAERDQLGLWLSIMNDSLGPITVEENPEAKVNKLDAMKFLAEPPPESQTQKMDIDDLLDDM